MLAAQHRVTSGVDYRRISRATRVGGRALTVHATLRSDAASPTRFGFIITKRVGIAVSRNLMRRRLKAICAELLPALPAGIDFVIRVHPDANGLPYDQLRRQLRRQALAVVGKLRPEQSEQCSCSDMGDDD